MAEEQQCDNMVGKPLFDILSKLPSKSLLRFRCVSKLWREYIDDSYFVSVHDKQVIEDPTPIMFYLNESRLAKSHFFHTIESHNITNHVLKAKNKVPVFDFVGKKLLSPTARPDFVCSCNGLVLIQTRDLNLIPTFIVIHPMNKQCYVLPHLPLHYYQLLSLWSCGLGFDSSTNTFKMVCLYYNLNPNCGVISSALCTMVHVFGTNSWHTIPQLPSYGMHGKAIFAHGCLHWLVECNRSEDGPRQVICFDVKNEEFGLIEPPKTISKPSKRFYNQPLRDHLVNLDGQVGYFGNRTTEVWILNHKKEWALHCDFEDHDFHDGHIKVLGCLNKDGDILIKVTELCFREERCIIEKWFYIYNLKNRVMHEARIDGLDLEDGSEMDIVMFPNSLLDIIRNSNLIKKSA